MASMAGRTMSLAWDLSASLIHWTWNLRAIGVSAAIVVAAADVPLVIDA